MHTAFSRSPKPSRESGLQPQQTAALLKTLREIETIATTLPPVIKNDTPSYMVPSVSNDTNDGAKDHMYGASIRSVVPPSSAILQKVGPDGVMYAFEIHSKSFRDLIELRKQSSLNENTLLAAKKAGEPAY